MVRRRGGLGGFQWADDRRLGGGSRRYEAGMKWSMEKGISDGSNPVGPVAREQIAVMLYRYVPQSGDGFRGVVRPDSGTALMFIQNNHNPRWAGCVCYPRSRPRISAGGPIPSEMGENPVEMRQRL